MAFASIKTLRNLQELRQPLVQFSIPLVLLLSRSDCPFCQTVRNNYLSPLVREVSEEVLLIRELTTDLDKEIIGWHGERVSTSQFLKSIDVKFFPTVVFLNANGMALTEALVGLDQAGFFGAYLERSLERARRGAKIKR